MKYIDDYSTCEETYATLLIYPKVASPADISKRLGLQPTEVSLADTKDPDRANGWFLTSEGLVDSKDSRRHIDWLLDQIEPVAAEFLKLTKNEAEANISCYWLSAYGHGGPAISPYQMARLVTLNLEVSWDTYYLPYEEENA